MNTEEIMTESQNQFEKLVRLQAEIEINISRLSREKSDISIRISALEKLLHSHAPSPSAVIEKPRREGEPAGAFAE